MVVQDPTLTLQTKFQNIVLHQQTRTYILDISPNHLPSLGQTKTKSGHRLRQISRSVNRDVELIREEYVEEDGGSDGLPDVQQVTAPHGRTVLGSQEAQSSKVSFSLQLNGPCLLSVVETWMDGWSCTGPLVFRCSQGNYFLHQQEDGQGDLDSDLYFLNFIFNWRMITILPWLLPHVNMKQPQVCTCSRPSGASLPPPSPPHASRFSRSTGFGLPANSHWLSILHMVMHTFQCCSRKSSHPPPPPLCPKICPLCLHLHCCLASWIISAIFLDVFHRYVLIYNIGLSLSDLTSPCMIGSRLIRLIRDDSNVLLTLIVNFHSSTD